MSESIIMSDQFARIVLVLAAIIVLAFVFGKRRVR